MHFVIWDEEHGTELFGPFPTQKKARDKMRELCDIHYPEVEVHDDTAEVQAHQGSMLERLMIREAGGSTYADIHDDALDELQVRSDLLAEISSLETTLEQVEEVKSDLQHAIEAEDVDEVIDLIEYLEYLGGKVDGSLYRLSDDIVPQLED